MSELDFSTFKSQRQSAKIAAEKLVNRNFEWCNIYVMENNLKQINENFKAWLANSKCIRETDVKNNIFGNHYERAKYKYVLKLLKQK
jgi:hypothetical protein